MYPTLPARCSLPKKKREKLKTKQKDTPIRREGEPFSRIEEKHFLHVTKRSDDASGRVTRDYSVRTLVAIKVKQRRWRGMEERKKRRDNFLMRKMDDCVDSPGPPGDRWSENSLKIRETRRAMHQGCTHTRWRREIGRVSLSRRVDPRYSLPSISLFTSVSSWDSTLWRSRWRERERES